MKEQKRRIWLYMAIMILTTLLVLCLGTLVGLVYIDERKVNEKIVYKTIMNLHVRGSVIRNVQNGTTVVYLCSL